MRRALDDAGLTAADVAARQRPRHSTPLNDAAEATAVAAAARRADGAR